MSWATSPNRKAESLFSIPIIQMGARVYLPSLGRFLQVDPIEGGTDNAYAYVNDPVNNSDYSGEFSISGAWNAAKNAAKTMWNATVSTAKAVFNAVVVAPVKVVVNAAKPAVAIIAPYVHYLTGGGTPVSTKTSSYQWNTKQIAGSAVKSSAPHPVVTCMVVKVSSAPTDTVGQNVVGTSTLLVGGNLNVNGNSWQFKGRIIGGYDGYNFDSRWGTPGSRGTKGELLVFGGAFVGAVLAGLPGINPTNYNNFMEGDTSINEAGTF